MKIQDKIEKLVKENYNDLWEIADNICKDKSEARDLLHEGLIVILEYKKKQKLKDLNKNGLRFFMARIMQTMFFSKTSRYYYNIKKWYDHHCLIDTTQGYHNPIQNKNIKFIFKQKEDDGILKKELIEKRLEFINNILKKLYWYDRELFKLYYFGKNNGRRYSLTSLSKKTGISRKSIFTTIKNVRELIKDKIKGNDI